MSDSIKTFCNLTWEPRWNEVDQVMTMPQFKPDGEADEWQMMTVGCLGVVRVNFADIEAWAKQMRFWVDSVEKQAQEHRDSRARLGLDTL